MKRSEINRLIKESISFFNSMNFKLPAWGYWTLNNWLKYKDNKDEISEIIDNMLGWDLTDYGGGDFRRRGLILFTIRNGNLKKDKKPYAEKIMISDELQDAPMHFHWNKMEDIINRGGGNLAIELYGSTKEESLSKEPVAVKIDGIRKKVNPGGTVILKPGESICLEPGVYHRFYAEKGHGKVMIGEVSMVNNDLADNRFYEPQGRFPAIEEDESPAHLLCNDYGKIY